MSIVSVPLAGQYGVIADSLPQELPVNAWSRAQNMRFADGYAERMGGQTNLFTTPAITPYFVTGYQTPTAKLIVHAGLTAVYTEDGTTRTNITGTAPTGAIDDRWTGGSLNGVLVLNNGVDKPFFYTGTGTLATLTGWNAVWKCGSLRPFKNYLVATSITKTATVYPNMVKWSASAQPGTIPTSWDEADATKDAGEQDLAETGDSIVDTLPLGDVNVVYKDRSMYGMQYIGQPFIFRFFRLPGDFGMLGKGCVAAIPQGHVVLCAGDVVLHNGQGPQSILNARMRRYLFSTIDGTNFRRSFVVANLRRNEVLVCYPTNGSATCNQALVWNYKDDTLGIRDLPGMTYGAPGIVRYTATSGWNADAGAWDADSSAWDSDPYGAVEPRVVLSGATELSALDVGNDFNGTAITGMLERTGMAFDAPDVVKTIRAVYPRLDGNAGTAITVEVGGSMNAESPPTWSAPVTYIKGTTFKADTFATGRFLSVRFTSVGGAPWRIKSYDLDMVKRGRY